MVLEGGENMREKRRRDLEKYLKWFLRFGTPMAMVVLWRETLSESSIEREESEEEKKVVN